MHSHPALSLTTKIVVTTVGALVILAGFVMLVAPGPGIVAIILGLAILATEWDWAERWMKKAKEQALRAQQRAMNTDPAARRRRLVFTGVGLLVVLGAGAAFIFGYGWPGFAVEGWDWVQGIAGWLPELPGPTAEAVVTSDL
jgi:uncharacterized protein (TIGR02611 family)